MVAQTPEALRAHAHELLTRVSETQLRPGGKADIADRAWRAFNSEHQLNSVVLVGEVKRGKSALANALVGTPDLSPSGSSIATAIPVVLGPATDQTPAGKATIMTASGPKLVDASSLPALVTSDAGSVEIDGTDEFAAQVYVATQGNLLGDVVVIDTPGVGGIEGDAARISSNTARSASVIVVVADAAAPLTAPEMNFITRAVARTEAVIVAVTKTDKHLTRWREIVEEDRRLLIKHTGRDIPVVGVSTLLPHLAQPELQELSGIAELRKLIAERFAHAENIPAANGLRIAVEGLRDMEASLAAEVASRSDNSAVLPELSADLARLESLQDDQEQWKQYLDWDISQAKMSALHALDDQLNAVREKWTSHINTAGLRVLREEPKRYTQLMGDDFQSAAQASIAAFSTQLENGIIASRFESDAKRREVMEEIENRLLLDTLRTDDTIIARRELIDRGTISSGVAEGTAFSGMVAGLLAVTGIGAIAGIGWTAVSLGLGALRQGKSALLQWLDTTSKMTADYVKRSLETVEVSARPAITIAYRSHLKDAISETNARIEEAQRSQELGRVQREEVVAMLTARQQEARAAAEELEAAITELMKGAK